MPWAVLSFISDLRGIYAFGEDNLTFAVKSSDLPYLRVGGGRIFGLVDEGFLSFSYRGVSVGLRYFGTGDSLYRDEGVYLAYRFRFVGFSALYGRNLIGSSTVEYGGGFLSLETFSGEVLLRAAVGYSITPLVAVECVYFGGGFDLTVLARARPQIYNDVILQVKVPVGDVRLGGTYRSSGNVFGIVLEYGHPFGRSSLILSTHESLGESVFTDHAIPLVWD